MWAGSSSGPDSRVNQFLVAGDVETVRPLGEGDWTVRMTPPWTPEARGARPLRLVLVTDDADIDDPGAAYSRQRPLRRSSSPTDG